MERGKETAGHFRRERRERQRERERAARLAACTDERDERGEMAIFLREVSCVLTACDLCAMRDATGGSENLLLNLVDEARVWR